MFKKIFKRKSDIVMHQNENGVFVQHKNALAAAGTGVALMSFSVPSFAAVDAAITTAITTMAADAVTVAAAVLVAIIGVVAIKFIRKGL